MEIEQLFSELKIITKDKEAVFTNSGITNWSNKMQYGFFPLGLGILTENNKTNNTIPTIEIEEGSTMVLGNDFGTLSYVNSYVDNPEKRIGETDSKTIKNLICERVGLDINKTFFTNFYLGIRDDEKHVGTNMTKRMIKLNDDYKQLCYKFFIIQLNLINPHIVICLGNDVKKALIENCQITNWKKIESLKNIYNKDKQSISIEGLGDRKFIIIPHPCDLRNFRQEHINKLKETLNKT